MPTAPANPITHPRVGKNVKNAIKPQVRIKKGGNPAEEDLVEFLIPTEIRRTNGMHFSDTCELYFDITKTFQQVRDLTTVQGWNYIVEVWQPNENNEVQDANGKYVGTILHWGEVSIQQALIDGQSKTEGLQLTSRVEPRHFGNILYGQIVCGHDNTLRQQHTDVIFNPRDSFDDKIHGNMSSRTEPLNPGDSAYPYHMFVDPQSAQTTLAVQGNRNQTALEWVLPDAIKYLCYTMNYEQKYIDNPLPEDIEKIFGAQAAVTGPNPTPAVRSTAPALRNFHVKRGEYLPNILDQILQPHGFDWCLVPTKRKDSTNRMQIKIFKYGEGEEKNVFLQAPAKVKEEGPQDAGPELDLSKTNMMRYDGTMNVADLANHVVVQGDFIEREITVELYRAWPESKDSMFAQDLKKSVVTEANRFVWRKWVLNEGGDYTGLRQVPLLDLFSFANLLGPESVVKRRRFHDCLAKDPDGRRRDPLVEFWNESPDDGGAARWDKVKHQCHILTRECGVMFDDEDPPEFLMNLGSGARIRVTATVRGDTRVTGTATPDGKSPNGNPVVLFIPCWDIFADRQVQKTGNYASSLKDSTNGHDTKDDTQNIQKYAEAVRNQEDAARLTASFVLHGIHTDYQIGQIVTKIEGRNISFNRYNDQQGQKKYLQIVAVTFDIQNQTTTLNVDSLELKKKDQDTGYAY